MTTVSGNVTVIRTTWAKAVEAKMRFGWDYWAKESVRVTINGEASVADLIKSGAARINFANGECRVWLCAFIPDAQTRSNVDHMIMRPTGFAPAPELDTSHMQLLEATEAIKLYSIGKGLKNWTKQMTLAEYNKLMEVCCICCCVESNFTCLNCIAELDDDVKVEPNGLNDDVVRIVMQYYRPPLHHRMVMRELKDIRSNILNAFEEFNADVREGHTYVGERFRIDWTRSLLNRMFVPRYTDSRSSMPWLSIEGFPQPHFLALIRMVELIPNGEPYNEENDPDYEPSEGEPEFQGV